MEDPWLPSHGPDTLPGASSDAACGGTGSPHGVPSVPRPSTGRLPPGRPQPPAPPEPTRSPERTDHPAPREPVLPAEASVPPVPPEAPEPPGPREPTAPASVAPAAADSAHAAHEAETEAPASGTVRFLAPSASAGEYAVLGAVALLGVVTGLVVVVSGAAGPSLAAVPYCLAALAPAAALGLRLLGRRGDTVAGPGGLVNRRLWTVRRIPWHEMTGFEVRAGRSGRSVVVLRRHGRPVILAAPAEGGRARDGSFGRRLQVLQTLAAAYRHEPPGLRERTPGGVRRTTVLLALLAVAPPALAAWSPWLDVRWPARHEAVGAADPCALARSELDRAAWRAASGSIPDFAGGSGQAGYWRRQSVPGVRRCWRQGPGRGVLAIELEVHTRSMLRSASSRAAAWMASERRPGDFRTIGHRRGRGGIEIQARTVQGDTTLMARRANAVLIARWTHGGAAGRDHGVGELSRIARAVLARLELR